MKVFTLISPLAENGKPPRMVNNNNSHRKGLDIVFVPIFDDSFILV